MLCLERELLLAHFFLAFLAFFMNGGIIFMSPFMSPLSHEPFLPLPYFFTTSFYIRCARAVIRRQVARLLDDIYRLRQRGGGKSWVCAP